MKSAAVLLFVIACAIVPKSKADEMSESRTYTFGGGACPSQGTWTQDALAATQNLLTVAEQLKKDPNCGALSHSLSLHLTSLRQSMNVVTSEATAANKLSSLKEETIGLRNFVNASGPMRNKVIDLILNNTIEAMVTASDLGSAGGGMVSALATTGQRINRATTSGMGILEKVMDAALQEQTCLATPNTAGPFLSSMIEITSAFAGSGQDSYGNRMAALVNKISTLMRSGKYANVMKQLNQTQLRNSISCLVEVASNSYCSTLDAENLFKEQMSRQSITSYGSTADLVANNQGKADLRKGPLVGYYILSQHIPELTRWLEKVQLGVEPKLKTDAANQIDILSTTNNFYYTEKDLLGNFNQAKSFLKDVGSVQGKKNLVLKTLMQVSERLTNNINTGVDNFYTVSNQPREIPFVLLGIPVPPDVLGKGNSGIFQSPADWIGANMAQLPEFDNPEQLMETIDMNLRKLIENSRKNAVSYYSKWFIYDDAALVFDSVSGLHFKVRDSLKTIRDYLEGLEQKISQGEGDVSTLQMINETQLLIETVLEKYDNLRDLGEAFKKAANKDEKKALIEKGRQINRDLIETAYERFNVQKGKSGFLANRLALIVKKDFETMLAKNKNFTSDTIRNIFFATGDAAFERMKQMSAAKSNDVMIDLSNAQTIHKQNLEAIEMLFKDHFLATIAYTKMVAENRTPNGDDVRRDSWKRAMKDYMRDYPIASGNIVGMAMELLVKPFDFYFSYYKGNSDRYPRTKGTGFGKNTTGAYLDTETGAAKRMYEFYCIQSLGFSDWRPFRDLCKSVVLQSPFVAQGLNPQAQQLFNDTLNVSYDKKLTAYLTKETAAQYNQAQNILKYGNLEKMTPAQRAQRNELVNQLARNHSARICAYQQYSRNNEVMKLTLGKSQ